MSDNKARNSAIIRMVVIAFLTLALLIPTVFVQFLISDRDQKRSEVINEVSESWGKSQVITGPFLTIPYRVRTTIKKGETQISTEHLHILPEQLTIDASIAPTIRYRGIYEVVLYSARLTFSGNFPSTFPVTYGIDKNDILWDEAYVTLGITDLKGIKESIDFTLNSVPHASEPGVHCRNMTDVGVTFRPRIQEESLNAGFTMRVDLNGSTDVRFVPVGKTTIVTASSRWTSPSFSGAFLPETREVSGNGFHARWKVLDLNRNFPQSWKDGKYDLASSAFGIKFLLPADGYQKTERTLKYAILFIALTFLAFFLSEIIAKVIVHPIQYALIGFALVLFYVLLLSLTEHMTFTVAYLCSSTAVILLITIYASWISVNKRIALVILSVLIVLYGFLFITLQMEDYALLIGAVGLFVILALVMFITRKINWFTMGTTGEQQSGEHHNEA